MRRQWMHTRRLWLMGGRDVGEGVSGRDDDPYLGQLVVVGTGVSSRASGTWSKGHGLGGGGDDCETQTMVSLGRWISVGARTTNLVM
jgi:hypothetical protein